VPSRQVVVGVSPSSVGVAVASGHPNQRVVHALISSLIVTIPSSLTSNDGQALTG
jgi:hypothetical protein